MPYVASIGTYLPCWGTPHAPAAGAGEDSITLAVEGGVDRPHLSHVDVVEVHDFCTGNELISYEDHGFAERRGGYKLVEVDVTTIGGGLLVKSGGGLKAKAVKLVDGPRISLAHNIGGPTVVSAVTILEGAARGAR